MIINKLICVKERLSGQTPPIKEIFYSILYTISFHLIKSLSQTMSMWYSMNVIPMIQFQVMQIRDFGFTLINI